MKKTIQILSILIGIISLVSFIQRLFDIGVITICKELIDYYRTIAYFFFNLPLRVFGLHFPKWLMDIWTLSLVGAASYVKTPNIENARFFRLYPVLIKGRYWKLWFLLSLGLSGIGLAFLFVTFWPMTYVDEFHEEPLDLSKRAGMNIFYIIGGAIAFFILNAFGPTI
ncbi:MAG: hypothetical protein HXY46_02660 [Syntrophaceae bacterium]|nr:hypothetical protein [Syntrophaceae bacterium]